MAKWGYGYTSAGSRKNVIHVWTSTILDVQILSYSEAFTLPSGTVLLKLVVKVNFFLFSFHRYHHGVSFDLLSNRGELFSIKFYFVVQRQFLHLRNGLSVVGTSLCKFLKTASNLHELTIFFRSDRSTVALERESCTSAFFEIMFSSPVGRFDGTSRRDFSVSSTFQVQYGWLSSWRACSSVDIFAKVCYVHLR